MNVGCVTGQSPASDEDPNERHKSVTPASSRTEATPRVRVERLVTSGTFSLEEDTTEVENNIWILGDDERCVVIDPADDPAAVFEAIDGRAVAAVLLTHGDGDQNGTVQKVATLARAPVYLHSADMMLWERAHRGPLAHRAISDGDTFVLGGVRLMVLHTPGHSPGSVCFHAPDLGARGMIFSGDTLVRGGPGATGRSYSDFPTIIESIRARLLNLPRDTVVLPGHGQATTVGAEAPHLKNWLERGH
jgi:glyoxylase-like metal-dependent hydrolase (beta-lactamase superfamily II)